MVRVPPLDGSCPGHRNQFHKTARLSVQIKRNLPQEPGLAGLDPQARFGRSGQGRLSGTPGVGFSVGVAGVTRRLRHSGRHRLTRRPKCQEPAMFCLRYVTARRRYTRLSLVLLACQLDEHGPEDGVSLHAHATYPLVFQLQHACPIGVCSSIPVLGPHH